METNPFLLAIGLAFVPESYGLGAFLKQVLIHGFQYTFSVIHPLVGPLEHPPVTVVFPMAENRHPAGNDRPIRPHVLINLRFKSCQNNFPVSEIFTFQERNKLIPANPEYRAVFEMLTDNTTTALDILVPRIMAFRIVDLLQPVQIKDHYTEFLDIVISDPLVHLFFNFHIGVRAFDSGEGIRISQLLCRSEFLFLLCFSTEHFFQFNPPVILHIADNEGVDDAGAK